MTPRRPPKLAEEETDETGGMTKKQFQNMWNKIRKDKKTK
jgi:hypothetical protein